MSRTRYLLVLMLLAVAVTQETQFFDSEEAAEEANQLREEELLDGIDQSPNQCKQYVD